MKQQVSGNEICTLLLPLRCKKGLSPESRERKKSNAVNLICFQSARALYRNCSNSPFTCVHTSAAKPSSSNQFQLVGWHGQFTGPAAERGPRILDVTAKHETKDHSIGFVPATEINYGLLQSKSNASGWSIKSCCVHFDQGRHKKYYLRPRKNYFWRSLPSIQKAVNKYKVFLLMLRITCVLDFFAMYIRIYLSGFS